MMTRRKSAVLCSGLALVWGALTLSGCGGGEKPAAEEAAATPAEGAAPAAPAAAGPSGTATVSGSIAYEGEVPNLKPVSMSADPTCAQKHGGQPVASDVLALGPNKELGNVFVYVKEGLPDAQWAPPATPAVIDQQGCMYKPHVMGVVVGQTLQFHNSDGMPPPPTVALHNVHALPKVNQEFNVAMPAGREVADHRFDQAEGMFTVKCDVHPWMNAYVGVLKHPFFSVSGTDGQFNIANLPAGTYTLEAWHERLGTQTQQVTVTDGGTATASFVFKRPAT
jgi:plastocyanin